MSDRIKMLVRSLVDQAESIAATASPEKHESWTRAERILADSLEAVREAEVEILDARAAMEITKNEVVQ